MGRYESGGLGAISSTPTLASATVFQNDVAATISSDSAPSVYFSDDISFLCDIVNALVDADSNTSRSNTPTAATSTQASAVQNNAGRSSYEAHAATVLSYVVGGLIGLWGLYQLHRWFQFKIRKIKEDKKLLAELALLGDHTTKPRYPVYEALFTFVGVNIKPDPPASIIVNAQEDVVEDVLKPAVVARKKRAAKGAYINGPDFVDLEANERRISGFASDNTISNHLQNMTMHENSHSLFSTSPLRALEHATSEGENIKAACMDAIDTGNGEIKLVAATISSDSAPSVYFSDDSSFLSDIVNALIDADSISDVVSSIGHSDNSSSAGSNEIENE
eukprot:gene9202-10856_t